MSSHPITTLPSGHSLVPQIEGGPAIAAWIYAPSVKEVLLVRLTDLQDSLKQADDGTVSWTDDPTYFGHSIRPIPDSEWPPGGMTRHHSVFDATETKVWTLPNIESRIHEHHERTHEASVTSAVAEICGIEINLMMKKAVFSNLNPDQTLRANMQLTDFENCVDEIVEANIAAALEQAWIKSVGHITHPATPHGQTQKAKEFAEAYVELIGSKTTRELVVKKFEYSVCLFRELLKDRGKTANRFLPKGVTLVDRKSSPAKAEEVTKTELFNKLRGRLFPAEGQSKRA